MDKMLRPILGENVALRAVRADVLVLGVCSLHPEFGITVNDLEESYVKRAMIANASTPDGSPVRMDRIDLVAIPKAPTTGATRGPGERSTSNAAPAASTASTAG